MAVTLGVASGSSHVFTDEYMDVGPDGYWIAEVAAGEHQRWSFYLTESREHNILVEIDAPEGASLSVWIDGSELGTVSGVDLFTLNLEPGPHAVIINNPGEVPVRYQFYMGITLITLDLAIEKDDGGVSVVPGGTISYMLTITNITAVTGFGTGVVLTETVPDHTTFNPGSSSLGWGCAPDNNAGSICTRSFGIVTVSGGQVFFAVDVDNPLQSGVTQIDNTASISGAGIDSNISNNIARDSTPIRRAVGGTTSFLSGGSGSPVVVWGILASVAAAFAILLAGGWYTQRRRLGNRS